MSVWENYGLLLRATGLTPCMLEVGKPLKYEELQVVEKARAAAVKRMSLCPTLVRKTRPVARQPDVRSIPPAISSTKIHAAERRRNEAVRRSIYHNISIPVVYGGHRTK